MKLLFIGGTGIISSACVARAVALGHEVYLLRRGVSESYAPPLGTHTITGDIRGDEAALQSALAGHNFDVVCDFLAFLPEHIERALRLFQGKCQQYVFVSSASCYQRPLAHYKVTEETPLENAHWQYSRDKIASEKLLTAQSELPWTIVRPSLTFGEANIPLVLNSWAKPWTVAKRMREGKEVIMPGDGSSLWGVTWNEDFAVGFVGLLGREDTLSEAFHISTDEVLTWKQLFLQAGQALGVEPKLVPIASELLIAHHPDWEGTLLGDKAVSIVLDNSKIKKFVPEYQATTKWADAVARSVAWYDAEESRKTIDEAIDAKYDAILAAYRKAFP
ncbi:MAG: NAD-dependent epimerase/dehydratase family protein [Armatimonas sp.]